MAGPEQVENYESPVIFFSQFAIEQASRFHDLSVFHTRATEIVSDMEKVNTALTDAGRPDLAIDKPAEMIQCATLEDIQYKTNNFASKFIMSIGKRETGKRNNVTCEPIIEPIPVTEKELEELRELPVNTMLNTGLFTETEGSGLYFLFKDSNHALKPAFTRMLLIFPEFTKKLVLEMSEADYNKQVGGYFLPEVFVAYQLMSKLVNASDIDGTTIDPRYLCI